MSNSARILFSLILLVIFSTSYGVGAQTFEGKGVLKGKVGGTSTMPAVSGSAKGSVTVTVRPVLTRIVIQQGNSTVQGGRTQNFTATGYDQSGKPMQAAISWSVSNPAIGSIDANGKFTAKGTGAATIMAVSGRVRATVTVTVLQVVTKIVINPVNVTVDAGKTHNFNAKAYDQSGKPMQAAIGWSVSNPAIGSIDANGKFTGKDAGTATITASSGNVKATATATVKAVLAKIVINPVNVTVDAGKGHNFTATGYDQSGKQMSVAISWNINNNSIGSIDAKGMFTAKNGGAATITASSGNVKASVNVTVTVSYHIKTN